MLFLSLQHIFEMNERMLSSYPHLLCTTLQTMMYTYAHPVFSSIHSLMLSEFEACRFHTLTICSWIFSAFELPCEIVIAYKKKKKELDWTNTTHFVWSHHITPKQLIWRWFLRCTHRWRGTRSLTAHESQYHIGIAQYTHLPIWEKSVINEEFYWCNSSCHFFFALSLRFVCQSAFDSKWQTILFFEIKMAISIYILY